MKNQLRMRTPFKFAAAFLVLMVTVVSANPCAVSPVAVSKKIHYTLKLAGLPNAYAMEAFNCDCNGYWDQEGSVCSADNGPCNTVSDGCFLWTDCNRLTYPWWAYLPGLD